jgi:signal-transduction protein with cAMP-binding, CBS, and nucleotidyltransferase domain
MTATLREVMAKDPVTLSSDTPLVEAARNMKDKNIGDVIVLDGDNMCGVVTDRDIVVRAIAEGRDPEETKLGDVCTHDVVTLGPDASVDDAVKLMREKAVRRIPVEEDGKPIGIVSLGDIAMEHNPNSILADISEKGANN